MWEVGHVARMKKKTNVNSLLDGELAENNI
jgi:hypothetical protein